MSQQNGIAVNSSTAQPIYHRAKQWQIILYAMNGLLGMAVYSLINLASYSANIGYGITMARSIMSGERNEAIRTAKGTVLRTAERIFQMKAVLKRG